MPTVSVMPTRDGLSLHLHLHLHLYLRHWPCTPSVGTVRVVHGLGEHGGRCAPLATRLNAWGWHVAAHDHRGHGHSAGPRGRRQQNDDLLHDLATVIDHVLAARPTLPACPPRSPA